MINKKTKPMKIKPLLLFLFLTTFTFAQNSLKVVNLAAGPADKAKIIIDLTNLDEVVGAEFTLTLPQGLLVSEKDSKIIESRKGDHAVYVNIEKNNPRNYHFIILSLTSAPFKGNSGTLLELPIEIPLNYTEGQTHTLALSGVVLSSKNAIDIGSSHTNGTLTIATAQFADLTISGITTNESKITPEGKITVSWGVDNIGEKIASGGWIEQVSIVSDATGLEYNLGTVSYNEDLDKKKSVSRNATINLPKILGIDGNVKVKINLIANASVKEPEALKTNNKITATNAIVLEKVLFLTLDKKRIAENSTEVIRATLTQSGDRSADKVYNIVASQLNQLGFDATVKIAKDQSSVVFYIKPTDNSVTDGNRIVKLTLSGNDFTSVSDNIEIIDNEFSVITLTPSKVSATDGDVITVNLESDFAKSTDTKFTISADQNSRWIVPIEVILPAGSKTASFTITVKNNKVPEATVTGKLTLRAEGFQAGNTEVVLKSSNIPGFELEISPTTISKGDGVYATYATIKRLDKTDIATNVRLKPSIANALILPDVIDFPANVNQKKFNIGVINNGIVDGTKTVNVAAEVYISSCNCTVPAGSGGSVINKNITILDSNGPTLILKANPATVKAGAENVAKITVARNTVDTSTAILVKLSSDSPTIVTIPETVTIPVGSESVEVSISTKIDVTKTGDQTVRLTAEADSFTSGFSWILVTNQNKPDAIVSAVNTVTEAGGGENIEIAATLTNQGFAVLTKGSKLEFYLSKDKLVKNGTLLTTVQLDKDIESGKSIDLKESVKLPQQAGDYFVIVAVNSDQKINELSYSNNESFAAIKLHPSYTATATVSKAIYKSGELVQITGSAKMLNNSVAANKEVEITIANGSFVRSFIVKTNASGNFAYDFEPLDAESGHYTVSAGYPGTTNPTQAEFDIIGFEWTNKPSQYLKWDVVEQTPFKGEFILKNNSKTTLTNIKVGLPADAGFTIQSDPLTLAAGQESVLAYTILAENASVEQKYYNINFTLLSEEGAKLAGLAYYHCKAQSAKLIVNPVSINTTMIKGTSRYYELSVSNSGAVNAENVKVELPKLDWMKLKSPAVIKKIAPNEAVKIILELAPTDKQQLNVPLSGSLALNAGNGGGISIPFKIETVSESTGSLLIDVIDEYTYNTEKAPHLKGAKVVVRHPFSDVILAEGITDDNGIFQTPQIPEGYYAVTVTANKHDTYRNNLLVDPGKVTTQKVFISYQAVSYEWVVKPTEIADEYETELVVKYETNVPVPVVVLDMDKKIQDIPKGGSYIMMATLTNKGLITAEDVYLQFPTDSEYKFTSLIDKIDILAKQSIQIPVKVERLEGTSKKMATGESCESLVLAWYTYECVAKHWVTVPHSFSLSVECPKPKTPVDIPTTSTNLGPTLPGDCGNCYEKPDGYSSNLSYGLNIPCGPCFLKVVKAVRTCGKNVKRTVKSVVSCVIAIGVAAETFGIAIPVAGYKCYKAVKSVMKCYKAITEGYEACNSKGETGKYARENSVLDEMYNNMKEYEKSLDAYQNSMLELFRDIDPEADAYDAFSDYVIPIVEKQSKFSQSDILILNALVSGKGITQEQVLAFTARWNNTVDAWNAGIFAPNTSYPNIVDKTKLNQYAAQVTLVEKYAKSKGYNSSSEMIEASLDELDKYIAEKSQESSVCASVTVKFSQKITMTREAFEGTLTMNNGSDDNTIKDINLDLLIKDEAGNDMTDLFQINKDAFLSGTGLVGPQSSKGGTVLFIPTKEAAPTVAKSYSFGGTLSYTDPATGDKVTVQLYPVTLEVNPSPDIVMHYFMQRDILGDDPLTDKIEPIVPAEMALLIKNEGYGIAKNVQVESVNPEIIENKKGLLIDFEIVGSNFNNEPKQLGLLNVDFGNIEPQKSAIGQWWFTSSLLGHFIEYDLKVKHLSSYGNKNLSLIKASYVHELIKSVKAYQAGHDNVGDFLVNDIADTKDTPDAIYYSNGESDEVYKVNTGTVSNVISPSQLTTILTMNSSQTGWNYGNMTDPGSDKYKLERVVRISDNLELPLGNFWQTFVTLKDGLEPKYENNLHFLDKISGLEKYTLYYTPINANVPKVISFGNVPSTTTKALESVQVNFNKAIDPNTFTSQNITLIHQGKKLTFDDSLIGKVNDSTFVLNTKTIAIASGYYELTVQCAGIKDPKGNEGTEGKSVSWIQIIGELGIVQFKNDQTQSQTVNSVEILFNKLVKPTQFTKEKLKLNGNEIDNISIVTDDNLKYTIVGLSEYNKESGNYELTVDLPSIKAEDNTQGLIVQSQKWKVDILLPEVKTFIPQYQGAVNSQNVTELLVTLNKPLSNFDKNWVSLFKGSGNLNANVNVTKQDDLHYVISGLGEYTQTAGGYKIVIDQSNFVDLSGNFGNGTSSTNWTVKFDKPLAPTNLRVTPDRGISATDNITSGNDLQIAFSTIENKRIVELYVITPQNRILLSKQYQETAKEIFVPIKEYSGKNTFEAITYDEFGNASDAVRIEAYLDNVDLGCTVSPLSLNNSCSEIDALAVTFDNEITASAFTKEALLVKEGGISVSNEKLTLTKISDKEFEISGIEKLNGDHTFGIDLSRLNKKSSGLQGKGMIYKTVETPAVIAAEIKGDLVITEANSITTYTTTQNMLAYQWNVTGGEIVEQNNNTVTIKWNEEGIQNLSLSYSTSALCRKTTFIEVKVDATLSTDTATSKNGLNMSPVPNNGNFTLTLPDNEGVYTLTIYDMNGRSVYQQDKGFWENSKSIVYTNLQVAGIYYLVIHNGDKTYKMKFLIK
jgi:hypothetical protein